MTVLAETLMRSLPWYFGVAVFGVWAGAATAMFLLLRRRIKARAERLPRSARSRARSESPARSGLSGSWSESPARSGPPPRSVPPALPGRDDHSLGPGADIEPR